MNLTSREKDKLLVSVAAMVAERRLKRGVKLNYPEAVALISISPGAANISPGIIAPSPGRTTADPEFPCRQRKNLFLRPESVLETSKTFRISATWLRFGGVGQQRNSAGSAAERQRNLAGG